MQWHEIIEVASSVDVASESAPTERIAAVRAVLAELPSLLSRLRDLRHGAGLPTGDRSVAATLGRMEARVRTAAPPASGALRCPRCGSSDVSTTYSDALDRRYTEVRCNACGLYEDWLEGDAKEDQWRPPSPSTRSVGRAATTSSRSPATPSIW